MKYLLILGCFLIVGLQTGAENLVYNSDFSLNGGSLDGWTVSDGTQLEFSGSKYVAYLSGENGVLYQKIVNGIEPGKTYECSINIASATYKQTTGYGYAIEKGSAISFPEFTKGSSQLNGICTGNSGIWQTLGEDIDSEEIRKFTIVAPEATTAIYICIGTKGAVANLRVNSVSLIQLGDQQISFNIKNTKSEALENAEIKIDGINLVYRTNESGVAQIDLPPSETAYQYTIECDDYQQVKGAFTLGSVPLSLNITMKDIVEVKKVETLISKYGKNDTPYPLYGHFWSSGMSYTDDEIDRLTSAFDYIIGGGGIPGDSLLMNKFHQSDPDFQVIRYNGGWTSGRAFCENHKLDLSYYRCGSISQSIDATQTTFTIGAPPSNKGKGIIASENDNFDVWIRIENELMRVVNVSSTQNYPITVTVERGFDGTNPAAHSAGSTVTLPLYGNAPQSGQSGGSISYFISNSGARKYKLVEAIFDRIDNYKEDGIWIDILLGRLNAVSLFNNKYDEWDHQTESTLSAANDVKYVKSVLNDLYAKFYSRRGFYPVIYGNNVLFANSYNSGSRGYIMEKTDEFPKGMDGFCHENSWGHMGSDESGIDHEGEVVEENDKAILYGSNGSFLEWYISNKWIDNCKAIALLAQKGLPNQPMTINAGYKNQWFAEHLNDEIRYNFNKYAYASYLMCVDVAADSSISCRMGISPMVKNGESMGFDVQPYFYYPIGIPVEQHNYNSFTQYRFNTQNLYSRKFSNGLVLLNPYKGDMGAAINITDITGDDAVYIDPENNNAVVNSIQLNSRETKILLLKDDTGNSLIESKGYVKVFPSPAHEKIFIENLRERWNEKSSIDIYDLMGNNVLTITDLGQSSKITVSVEHLKKGIYLVKVSGKNEIIKFIKK